MEECWGYQISLENHAAIMQGGMQAYASWKAAVNEYNFPLPEEIDPRGWFKIENQQQTSSCEGNSLADAGEFCNLMADGTEVQLSRYFAYLASQEMGGGMTGDNGAYLEAGTQAAARGIPSEAAFPWGTNYNAQRSKYRSEFSSLMAGPTWKYPGAIPLPKFEDAIHFLGTWSGPIQIGIDFTLDDEWETTSYRYGNGRRGHAILLCGYLKVDAWPMKKGILLKNSWGKSWCRDGWKLISQQAYDQMFASRYNVAIGRSEMVSPKPRGQQAAEFLQFSKGQWSQSL